MQILTDWNLPSDSALLLLRFAVLVRLKITGLGTPSPFVLKCFHKFSADILKISGLTSEGGTSRNDLNNRFGEGDLWNMLLVLVFVLISNYI